MVNRASVPRGSARATRGVGGLFELAEGLLTAAVIGRWFAQEGVGFLVEEQAGPEGAIRGAGVPGDRTLARPVKGGFAGHIEVTLRQYGLGLDPARARSSHLRKPVLQGLGGSQGRGWSPVSTVRRAQNRVDQLDGSRELSQQLGLLKPSSER